MSLREVWPKWNGGAGKKHFKDRTANAFFVPRTEIEENSFDLSINRFKEIVHEEEEYDSPKIILGRLKELEAEIASRPRRTGGDARMSTTTSKRVNVPLCEIADIERTAVSPENIKSGTKYVGLENMTSSGHFIGVGTVSNGDLASTKFAFTNEHILYGKLRPYLAKIARPEFAGICSTDILPILPGPKVDRGFLLHFLRQPRMVAYASSRTSGANLPRLSPKELATFEIPLPPLSEQKRLANILDKADAIRRKRQASCDTTDDLVRSTFLHSFGDPINNPHQWPIRKLGDIVTKLTDGEHLNPTFVEQGMPMIMAANVLHHGVSFDDVKFVTKEDGARFRKKCGPTRNDLLIVSRGATIGRCSIVDTDTPFCLMGSVILVKPNEEIAGSTYLKWLFSHHGYYNKLFKTSGSSAQQAIYLTHLRHLDIPVPPAELQTGFTSQVRGIQVARQRLSDALSETTNLFDSLVQATFKGEL